MNLRIHGRRVLDLLTDYSLVVKHLPLVHVMAIRLRRQMPRYVELDELVSAGNMGLIDACRRFDGRSPFLYFARLRIHGEMIESLRKANGRSRRQTISLNAPCFEGELIDYLEAREPSVLDMMIHAERCQKVRNALGSLNQKQQKVIDLMYFRDLRNKEIKQQMGLSAGRISQIHADAIKSLRQMIPKVAEGS